MLDTFQPSLIRKDYSGRHNWTGQGPRPASSTPAMREYPALRTRPSKKNGSGCDEQALSVNRERFFRRNRQWTAAQSVKVMEPMPPETYPLIGLFSYTGGLACQIPEVKGRLLLTLPLLITSTLSIKGACSGNILSTPTP